MVRKWKITIPELSGTEERNAYVYLPDSYEENPKTRYPVLYIFDGHNVFFDEDATYGKCWGMKEYMDRTETQMIIAAVECNHSPDHGRLREYAPFSFRDSQCGSITGMGHVTMEWLVHTFKPFIDREYRTLPDRKNTYIAGSSMGGLMSIYAVTQYNHIFRGAAALSPSVWTAPVKLEQMIRRVKISPDTVVYMDYGAKEMEQRPDVRKHIEMTAAVLLQKKVLLTGRIIPGGMHCEASWERQIPFFMNTLLYEP